MGKQMDLESLFAKMKQNVNDKPYLSINERRENLLILKRLLQKNANALADALHHDFSHRAQYETLFVEIFPTINAINYCLKNLRKWTKIRKRHVSWLFIPAYAYVSPQPLGVVGIIVPWNYPIFLSIIPLVYALASGNRVMVKISELTPKTGSLLESLMRTSGIKNTTVSIINGGADLAKEFASLPFNHLLFTGSTAVGKKVMKAASENLTPVTLELGGKSPAFISSSVNPHHFKRLFIGKLVNAGQTCIAPDFLLIPEGWESRIEGLFKEFIDSYYPNLIDNTNYTSIISDHHKERLQAMIDDARQKGANIIQFGEENAQERKMPFSLISNVNHSMRIMQEELFGPILPLMTYESLNEAIATINSMPNPLVIYYFGDNLEEKELLERETLSGALAINDTLTHIAIDDLPFGGVGQSGMGHYHGQEGFDCFSKLKPVFVQRRFSPITLFYPPYGKLMKWLLTWVGGIYLKEKK